MIRFCSSFHEANKSTSRDQQSWKTPSLVPSVSPLATCSISRAELCTKQSAWSRLASTSRLVSRSTLHFSGKGSFTPLSRMEIFVTLP